MDIFKDYRWHSSMELKPGIASKKIIRSLPAKTAALSRFQRVGKDGSYLVHKSTKALWEFSEDKQTIRPVFRDDVLTEDTI